MEGEEDNAQFGDSFLEDVTLDGRLKNELEGRQEGPRGEAEGRAEGRAEAKEASNTSMVGGNEQEGRVGSNSQQLSEAPWLDHVPCPRPCRSLGCDPLPTLPNTALSPVSRHAHPSQPYGNFCFPSPECAQSPFSKNPNGWMRRLRLCGQIT